MVHSSPTAGPLSGAPLPARRRRPAALPARLLLAALLLALLAGPLAGCAGDDPGPLEIIGTYTDEWGATQTITATTWSDSYGNVFHILSYDNLFGFLVAQNDAANAFNPSLYSRFAWARANGNLYYCQDPYDAASAEAARSAPFPDKANLTGGCAGFAWTNLTPP